MMDINKLQKFIDTTLDDFRSDLHRFCSLDEEGRKKAELISYWIKDYNKYLNFEDKFTPKKLKKYERGDVIKVNFGFNLGNEEGGLHYAVVIDNKNSQSSGVVTVIPLSTKKEGEKLSKFDVSLEYELSISVMNKMNKLIEDCRVEIEKNTQRIYEVEEKVSSFKELTLDEQLKTRMEIEKIREKRLENERNINYANRVRKEFSKMNSGTKALVGQITTISKMRIYDPKTSWDILSGIRLSAEKLERINEKIKELYIH